MNVTLRQLRAFAAVVECGSFTEAASNIHLTQSGLSVLVRELESALGVRVLDRKTRKIQMSEAGRHLYPFVQRVFNELGTGLGSIGQLRDKQIGLLRVAAPQLMACTLLPRSLAAFHKQFPRVEVRIQDNMPETFLEGLLIGDVEIAIGPDVDTGGDVVKKVLLRDRHHVVCPKDHALVRQKDISWKHLSEWPFIAPTQDFMKRVNLALERHQPSLQIQPAHSVSYMTTAIGMVAAGLGVTVLPSYAAPLVESWGLTMRPLSKPSFFRELCIFTMARKSLSPAADSFYRHLIDFVRTDHGTMEASGTWT